MASTRIFLDDRRTKPGKPSVLKIAIAHRHKTVYVSLNSKIFTHQWDCKKLKVINHPEQMKLNVYISGVKQKVDYGILSLVSEGKIASMTAVDIKKHIDQLIHPEKAEKEKEITEYKNLFSTRFLKFAVSKQPSTRKIYMHTYSRMEIFEGEHLTKLKFEDITKDWLTSFEKFLSETSPSQNARNIHFRNIRAVFNEAIDEDITTAYPFRRFKIRPVATAKRNLKVEDLRTLINYPCEKYAQKYLDMFKLMFMLIGINSIDLCHLKEISNGRINYHRAKTKRLYSIKVEKEAMEIIEKYRGKNWLLNILDGYNDYHDFTKHMNNALKNIGPLKRSGLGGKKERKPLFPNISSYWARHSWATIAASLDIPRDTIAHALGHGGNTVTDIYIDFDQQKVDDANRKVLDWVLYEKK
jgi:hypothetical protein